MSDLNYLDLFSGIGGFHLGLKWAGFKFNKVFYSDIEDYANKVYAKNFPNAIPLGDVTKIDPYKLPKIDIITGGFPCQDISCAGAQEGITGERSSLFNEIIRLSRVLLPRVIIFENVPNLINGGDGAWFRHVLESIASIGYDAEWEVISAAEVGAQHLRKRIWIIAYPNSIRVQNSGRLHTKLHKQKKKAWDHKFSLVNNGWKGFDPLPKSTILRKNHGFPNRLHQIKAIGNSVVPQVVQLIGELILESGVLE